MLYIWHSDKRGDWNTIHEENDVIETQEELAGLNKHTGLVMRTGHTRAYKFVECYSLTSEVLYVSHRGLLCTCCSKH